MAKNTKEKNLRRPIYNISAFLIFVHLSSHATAAGDASAGKEIASKWCSQCHVIEENQEIASADLPTFKFIADKYQEELDALGAFLADPHPPMPNLSLTRQEIQDLLAYIGSLN